MNTDPEYLTGGNEDGATRVLHELHESARIVTMVGPGRLLTGGSRGSGKRRLNRGWTLMDTDTEG